MFNILHVTDLHITDPKGKEEYLREDFFDEYVDSLVVAVRPITNGELDSIVITGDFVDRGNIANFKHATKVVNYLADKFKLPESRVVVCNGNHDLIRNDEVAGDFAKARKPFKEFASKFANGTPVEESPRGALLHPQEKLWFLMIDATLGSRGENNPGTLDISEADELMSWIKPIPSNEVLIIGTHYPVHNQMAEGAAFDEDDKQWSEHHLWGKGEVLKGRLIQRRRKNPQVIWLCGDIHKGFNLFQDELRFISTGRLGTRTAKTESQVQRHARVILVDENSAATQAPLLAFVPLGHSSQSQWGRWTRVSEQQTTAETKEISISQLTISSGTVEVESDISLESAASSATVEAEAWSTLEETSLELIDLSTTESATTEEPTTANPNFPLELVDPELQEVLIETIRESHLYQFGRFNTSPKEVSLAWVPIGLLLDGAVLPPIVKKMGAWLKKKQAIQEDDEFNKLLLIGMDCWGAVIASQLSVLTGSPNLCVAERGGGQHYLPSETLTAECFAEINAAKTIVVISDVVATGSSLVRLHDKICDRDHLAHKKRWLSLSILCDEQQNRMADCAFLDAHGTVCKDLRMPILSVEQLPPESILPPNISFD